MGRGVVGGGVTSPEGWGAERAREEEDARNAVCVGGAARVTDDRQVQATPQQGSRHGVPTRSFRMGPVWKSHRSAEERSRVGKRSHGVSTTHPLLEASAPGLHMAASFSSFRSPHRCPPSEEPPVTMLSPRPVS